MRADGAASSCFLLMAGLEGVICILMSWPLVVPLGALGGWLAYLSESRRDAAQGVAMLLLLFPATLTWDVEAPPQVFEVQTEITVAATPEQVWKHVVTFSELPEPSVDGGPVVPLRKRPAHSRRRTTSTIARIMIARRGALPTGRTITPGLPTDSG